jgi:L-alanine-DL-glutamate epimerase-like enolase superfamily enzyme
MKVTRLRTETIELPFAAPIGTGAGQLRSAGLVLVLLETDGGLVGEGLVFSVNAAYLRPIHALVHALEPLVTGRDPHRAGAFTSAAATSLQSFGLGGFAALACSGIEQALLDLRAKALGISVAELLGAGRSSIPAYASHDLWVSLPIDELQRNAARHLERGFRAMKMRLTGRIEQDVARVRAIRDAIGPDVRVMADANQKMSVPDAIRLGRRLEEFGIAWLEEPVSALDHAGEAAVAAALDMPVASGESVYLSHGAAALLRHRAADVIMLDLCRIGGPGEFLKAAALAQEYNTPASNHLFPEMSVSLLAAIPNAIILEYMDWVSPLYREPFALNAAGEAVLPERPGWGFSFDPDVIARHRI